MCSTCVRSPAVTVLWLLSLKEYCFGAIWIGLSVQTDYPILAHVWVWVFKRGPYNLVLDSARAAEKSNAKSGFLSDHLEAVKPPHAQPCLFQHQLPMSNLHISRDKTIRCLRLWSSWRPLSGSTPSVWACCSQIVTGVIGCLISSFCCREIMLQFSFLQK